MPKQEEFEIVSDTVPTATLATMPRLAKRQAVETFTHRLTELGIASPEAVALGRAVVDPADARRRLDRLTPVRVPGGTFMALETLVWSHAVVAYVVNNREASARHYPAGVEPGTAEAARFRPLRPPTHAADGCARLELSAEKPEHLTWSLERSFKFLLDNNDLSASIAAQGVLQPVTLAAIRTMFEDGSDPVVMLGTVDGSSRATGTHTVLDLTPHDVVMRLPRNERAFRSAIAEIQGVLDRELAEVSDEDVKHLRALQLPARIFLSYTPDSVLPVGFAKAVDSYVHIIHVEPAKPWDAAAGLDAKAASVVAELEGSRAVTRKRRFYLEGMYTPEEARTEGFHGEPDERALEVVKLISSETPKIKSAVRTGVIVLSKGGQVRKEEKAKVAVELALRANRSHLTRADAKGARETLQNAYLHTGIWATELGADGKAPVELWEAAQQELDGGGPGIACRRLAAQGAYWLAVHRVLREARFFETKENRDGRSAQRVLDDLMHTSWGLEVLHRAILDGRDGRPLARVKEDGGRVKGTDGQPMDMSHDWLRGTVVPLAIPGSEGGKPTSGTSENGADPGPTMPTRMLLNRRAELAKAVDRLEDAHTELRLVKEMDGAVLVDKDGLSEEFTASLRDRLEELRTRLAMYGMTWKLRNESGPAADEPEDDDDEEDAIDLIDPPIQPVEATEI